MLDVSTLVSAGLHHPAIKQYLAIKNRFNSENLACIEGLWALSLALAANLEIRSFFVCPALLRGEAGWQIAETIIASGTRSYQVSEKVLSHLVDWEGPDGLVALVQLRRFTWHDIQLRTHNVLLVLDGLQIPGNIGTIIRCADGAGADGILITNRQQLLWHHKLIRASMGSIFAFPIIEAEACEAIAWLKRQGFKIVTTDTDARLSYRQTDYRGRVAIVMGNERHGISPVWYEAQDTSVFIPMNGRADSLNVGNAAVLMLYEALHQQWQAQCS
jgi:TrmH family RNA methyltransferase